MNEIIRQMIEMEHKAQEMLADAERKKEDILRTAVADCDQTAERIDERRRKRIDLLIQTERETAEKNKEAIRKETEEKAELLERRFAEKKDEWVNEIYQSVIGR